MCCCSSGAEFSELSPVNVSFNVGMGVMIKGHPVNYRLDVDMDYGASSETLYGTLEEIRTHVQEARDSANEALKKLDDLDRKASK